MKQYEKRKFDDSPPPTPILEFEISEFLDVSDNFELFLWKIDENKPPDPWKWKHNYWADSF